MGFDHKGWGVRIWAAIFRRFKILTSDGLHEGVPHVSMLLSMADDKLPIIMIDMHQQSLLWTIAPQVIKDLNQAAFAVAPVQHSNHSRMKSFLWRF